VEIPVGRIGVTIGIVVGLRSKGCTGFGICSITIGLELSANRVPGSASVQNGKLVVDFLGMTGVREDVLPIDEDIVLDSATSQALGYRQVTIKKGNYPVDYKSNPNGHVVLDIATAGITIYVKFGRPSSNCRGFGVCEISVSLSLNVADNVLPAVAMMENGTLELQMLALPGEHGDTLPVEQDLVLDAATAKALGATGLTVKQGAYMVDYTSNPNGTVVLTTSNGSSAGVANEVALRGANSLMAKVTPNPVSSSATVSFVLPQSERVTLTVTNARGEEVARLMDGEFLTAGGHSARFNSASLPAGAYFYTVRAGATAETHPMQITK
jgi:hypothetical protein